MGGIVTLVRASVDQMAGSIALPMATTIGVIQRLSSTFDIYPAASAPAGAGVQPSIASISGDRLATNHTPLAHSALPLTHADHGHLGLSDPTPIGDTAHTLRRGG
jgi:hypothetical protein